MSLTLGYSSFTEKQSLNIEVGVGGGVEFQMSQYILWTVVEPYTRDYQLSRLSLHDRHCSV